MRILSLTLTAFLVASSVSGQAWLPVKGQGILTLDAQSLFVKDHIRFDGVRQNSGQIWANSTRLELTYGLTDRLTISGDATYVWSKFDGHCARCVPHGAIDDGSYNGTLQDARIDILYALVQDRVVLTPVVRVLIPLGDYSPQGHSAPGRHLLQASAGAYSGMNFGPFAPDVYVQAGYAYSVVEHVRGISTNRSNAEFEFGYFVTRSLAVRTIGQWQQTHGGFDLPRDFAHEGGFEIHDRVAKSRYLRFGLGATYALNRSTGVHLLLINTHSGGSTYASRAVSTGMSWTFGK